MSLLNMPWYVFPIIGAGVVYVSTLPALQGTQRAAEIEAALATEAPEVVALSTYQRPSLDTVKFAEATILAQIINSKRTRAIRSTGAKTKVTAYTILPLAAADATQTPPTVRGLIVLEQAEQEALDQFLKANTVATGPLGHIVELNGAISQFDPSDRAVRTLSNDGLSVVREAIYIEPFLGGRDAYLRDRLEGTQTASTKIMLFGFGIILIGFLKRIAQIFLGNRPRPAL